MITQKFSGRFPWLKRDDGVETMTSDGTPMINGYVSHKIKLKKDIKNIVNQCEMRKQ